MHGLAAFDVDGVLADVAHRRHHLARRDRDSLFAAAPDDPSLATGVTMARQCADAGLSVVYVSGRPERLQARDRRLVGPARTAARRAAVAPGPRPLPQHPPEAAPAALARPTRRPRHVRGRRRLGRRRRPRGAAAAGERPVFLADWQSSERDGAQLGGQLRRAQQVEGRT